jgi:Raf kinase inhibitor-like YbhB/YbcL family protein
MSDDDLTVELKFRTYPAKHTCEGEDLSPAIHIEGCTSAYLAIIMDDPDCPTGTFTHWTIWNIPARSDIPENISRVEHPPELPGSSQGLNTGRELGYMGPCPPRGKPHRYFLKVYGLGEPLKLRPGASKVQLEKAMVGLVLQYGEAMATYQRK